MRTGRMDVFYGLCGDNICAEMQHWIFWCHGIYTTWCHNEVWLQSASNQHLQRSRSLKNFHDSTDLRQAFINQRQYSDSLRRPHAVCLSLEHEWLRRLVESICSGSCEQHCQCLSPSTFERRPTSNACRARHQLHL